MTNDKVKQALSMMIARKSDKEIREKLGISVRTLASIKDKITYLVESGLKKQEGGK